MTRLDPQYDPHMRARIEAPMTPEDRAAAYLALNLPPMDGYGELELADAFRRAAAEEREAVLGRLADELYGMGTAVPDNYRPADWRALLAELLEGAR